MVIRLPGILKNYDGNSFDCIVTQKIETLNGFLGDAAKQRPDSWKYYKFKWAKALTIVPEREKEEYKAYTTIISYRTRLLDKENLYGGCKPIRDTLERRGWIWNDSPKWGDLSVFQTLCKKGEEKTYIRVVLID